MSFLSTFKIGSKIAILPVLAILGLLINTGVNTILRGQIGEMNQIIHTTHESVISLSKLLHLETKYLSNPDKMKLYDIEKNYRRISKYIHVFKDISIFKKDDRLLDKIKKTNEEHYEIFINANDIVLEILDHQNELTTLFHESDDAAGEKIDEISLLITHLMIEGKTLSASKRELRNSLREFVGLTSNAMLNTSELLFFSNPDQYEKAEEKRKKNLLLVTNACRALSLVTGDPDDSKMWKKIEKKQDRIKELRNHIYDHWHLREKLSEELKSAHEKIQQSLQELMNKVNRKTEDLIRHHKKLNIITFAVIFITFVLSGFFLVRNITTPIKKLTNGVRSFKKGRYSSIRVKTKDEIGILTNTFNEMTLHRIGIEKKLKQNETQFRQLAENIKEVFWIVSADWNEVIYISPTYEEVWGRSCESLYRNAKEWMNAIDKADIEKIVSFFKETVSGELSEIIFPEYRITRPDGSRRWISARGFPVQNEDGEVYRIVGLAEDITEQKQLNQNIQTLFKTTAGTTGQGFFNNVVRLLCEWLDGDVAIVGEIKNNTTVKAISMIKDGDLIYNFSYKLKGTPCETVRKDGFCHYPQNITSIFPEDDDLADIQAEGYIGTQIIDYNGNVIGILNCLSKRRLAKPKRAKEVLNVIASRISAEIERKNYELEREKIEFQLRQSQKMEAVGTLAGGIAHDFNNILFPLVGFSEMLQEDLPKDSPLQENVTEVLHAALRAKDLVKQILDFSRQSDYELKPVNLENLLQEVVKLLGSSIPKTIDIQTNIDQACGKVLADPTQIHQIIMNLSTNAYHAMQESGGRLTISLKQIELNSNRFQIPHFVPGNYAKLTVTDTGVGIKKEFMEKLFDPYFTTKTIGKGTGLGLSVVQGIVKSFNGNIIISSELGKGTSAVVYLPIMEKTGGQIVQSEKTTVQRGSETILLVDDEEPIIKMAQKILTRLGYKVITRTGSVEALEAFRSNPDKYDLIITDMTMPNMTGIQLANEIKLLRNDIPIIICTGFSEQINEESIKKLGIQGFVMKPLVINKLSSKIRSVLDE